jgi:hypothetical protein
MPPLLHCQTYVCVMVVMYLVKEVLKQNLGLVSFDLNLTLIYGPI